MIENSATASATDRLSSTLFVAALFHGLVILGITFTANPLSDDETLPTLRVTLVANGPDSQNPDEDADFLAQRSQAGSGDLADADRPTRALGSDSPITQAGNPVGLDLADGRPREPAPSADILLTPEPSVQQVDALPRPNENPSDITRVAADLVAEPSVLTAAAELDGVARQPDYESRELFASPSTRESTVAAYLNGWRSRVEQIGTLNFPAQARDQTAAENPTLEVAIDGNGRLVDIVIRQSSGSPSLDQAALTILRMAAPFEPLPSTVRAEYDVLRFAYEWEFEGG